MPKYTAEPILAEQFWSDGRALLPFMDEGACCRDGESWYVEDWTGHRETIVDGDYIIRQKYGAGFYPCKPDIFEASHTLTE